MFEYLSLSGHSHNLLNSELEWERDTAEGIAAIDIWSGMFHLIESQSRVAIYLNK